MIVRASTWIHALAVAAFICASARAQDRERVNVGLEAIGLEPAEMTIAEMMRGAGYRTALIGKWHLGHVQRGGRGPLPGKRIDGKSLAAILRSASAPPAHEVFHWQNGPQWAVRRGRWKLIHRARDTDGSEVAEADRLFLSDLDAGAGERHNVAAEHAAIVAELERLNEEWSRDVKDRS